MEGEKGSTAAACDGVCIDCDVGNFKGGGSCEQYGLEKHQI